MNNILKRSLMDNLTLCFPVVIISPKLNKTFLEEYMIVSDYCLSKIIMNDCINKDFYSNFDLESDRSDFCNTDVRTKEICTCVLNSFKAKPLFKIKLQLDKLLFSLFMYELERSQKFRCNVLKNFYKYSAKCLTNVPKRLQTCSICKETMWLIHADAYLADNEMNVIDYRWNKKLEVLINERCELDNAMAWLSTLGGAFSALGDYFVHCAEKAGMISMQQLRLALRIGDPITICQCRIYLAMSLLQRGYFSRAKNLIRESYEFAVGPEGSKDFRLKNMCIAVWNKLKYTISEEKKKITKHNIVSNILYKF